MSANDLYATVGHTEALMVLNISIDLNPITIFPTHLAIVETIPFDLNFFLRLVPVFFLLFPFLFG